MKKRILSLALAAALLSSLCACGEKPNSNSDNQNSSNSNAGSTAKTEYTHAPASPVTIELAAGGTSGSWYSIFASIAEIVNKEDCNIILKVVPGGGITNPATIGMGDAEMGLLYGSFGLAARAGQDPYTEPYEDLLAVTGGFMPMYLEASALANSGITSFESALTGDKAARILTGVKSTSTGWYFDRILEYYGTSAEDISKRGGSVTNTEYGDWTQMATDGHIDLMFNHIGIPSSTLQEIVTSREVVLLDLPDDLIDYLVGNYAMVESTIKAGAYDFLEKDIKTVMSPTVLAVNAGISDDAVYTLLEVLDKNSDQIRALHASLTNFDLSSSWESAGIPLHPGAEMFFKDKGYMK